MENSVRDPEKALADGFRFRVSRADGARIRRLAADSGLTLSRFLRAAALRKKLPPPRLPRVQLAAAGELARIGNNLNQLARHANSGRFSPAVAQELAELRLAVAELQAQLLESRGVDGE